MSGLKFEFNWEAGEGVKTPELRQTMARLSILVNGAVVTRVHDGVAMTVRDAIHFPLYALAEWVLTHWYPLLHESESAGRRGMDERHLLCRGGEGFALPRLSLISEGEWIRLSWQEYAVPYSNLRFLDSGEARLPRKEVAETLLNLIRATVLRLKENHGEHATLLEEEWESFTALTGEERMFCEVAGALGLDPFSTDEAQDERIVDATRQLPDALQEEFFASASWEHLEQDLAWVRDSLDLINNPEISVVLSPFRERVQHGLKNRTTDAPWQVGYSCAREVRQELGVLNRPLESEDLDKLGWRISQSIPRPSHVFDAVATMTDEFYLGRFAVSGRYPHSRRFAFARAFFECLTAQRFPRLVTRGATYTQKESRAFAAELLAPADTLRERITGDTVSLDEIADLAEDFSVSSMVIEHQITNHKIATVSY
ncbi:MAG: ImmA/IrrE family metallo-endopeptidase [Candidatus Hydrogenedentota bacterium]